MATISVQRLARTFVEVADTLVDEFDLIDFLHLLTGRAAAMVDAAAVGILLADARGQLQFMAGSDENVKLLELFQLQSQEGPCLEAFRTAQSVVNVDLEGAFGRWPKFAPRAAEAGFRSVHAFPLRVRQQVIGALNVFGAVKGGDFQEADIPIVQALADVASIGIIQQRTIRRGEVLTAQLQGALNSRIVIEQAKGAVAQAQGVSADDAFVLIRAFARSNNRRLIEVAHSILADPAAAAQLRLTTGGRTAFE